MARNKVTAEMTSKAREILQNVFDATDGSETYAHIIDSDLINASLYECSQASARSTVANMNLMDVKGLGEGLTDREDDGLPVLVMEMHDGKAKVVSTRNFNAINNVAEDAGILPVVLAWNGPQSIQGSGIFSITDALDIPPRLSSENGYEADMPIISITAESMELGHGAKKIARALDTIIMVSNLAPVPGDNLVEEEAFVWASRAEETGRLAELGEEEILARAIKIGTPKPAMEMTM